MVSGIHSVILRAYVCIHTCYIYVCCALAIQGYGVTVHSYAAYVRLIGALAIVSMPLTYSHSPHSGI